MIDLHTHILPGIDDGARTLEDALAMARVMVAEGVTVVAATPHVRDDFPTSANVMLHSVADLRRVLDEEEIPLMLLPGAEVAVDWLARLDDEELRRLSLAGSGRYVLVETPYRGWPVELLERLLRLRTAGFTPVLAHPERNPVVQATLVAAGLAHMVASDAHGPRVRAAGMLAALDAIRDESLARWLVTDVPNAIARGTGLPPRPR